jgi:hypothetical protein
MDVMKRKKRNSLLVGEVQLHQQPKTLLILLWGKLKKTWIALKE